MFLFSFFSHTVCMCTNVCVNVCVCMYMYIYVVMTVSIKHDQIININMYMCLLVCVCWYVCVCLLANVCMSIYMCVTGITILLSLSVFSLIVAESVPSTSLAVPLIGKMMQYRILISRHTHNVTHARRNNQCNSTLSTVVTLFLSDK